jgi:glutathione synthase/RimK-type ligase-like ATP-grasp enzyme
VDRLVTLRIALATCSLWPDLDEDGPELLRALADEGMSVDVRSWDDADVDWSSYQLVVLRTVWDYWGRHEEFLSWTRRVPRLLNSADVVAWNTDKTYLRRLADAGIPTVPTTWVEPGDTFDVPAEPFVIKPSVSAGARDTAAYEGGDETAREHVAALLAAGRTVMVQPYVAAVDTEGETAVLVFDGAVSHAARKSAVLALGAGEPELGGWSMAARAPSEAEVSLALRVLDEVRGWGDELLYARVDLLPGPVLIELEVTEPSLFLGLAPGSAQRFAAAVRRHALAPSRTATPRS